MKRKKNIHSSFYFIEIISFFKNITYLKKSLIYSFEEIMFLSYYSNKVAFFVAIVVTANEYMKHNSLFAQASQCTIQNDITCKTVKGNSCSSLIVPIEECGDLDLIFKFRYCNPKSSSDVFTLKGDHTKAWVTDNTNLIQGFESKEPLVPDSCTTLKRKVIVNTCNKKIMSGFQVAGFVNENYCYGYTYFSQEIKRGHHVTNSPSITVVSQIPSSSTMFNPSTMKPTKITTTSAPSNQESDDGFFATHFKVDDDITIPPLPPPENEPPPEMDTPIQSISYDYERNDGRSRTTIIASFSVGISLLLIGTLYITYLYVRMKPKGNDQDDNSADADDDVDFLKDKNKIPVSVVGCDLDHEIKENHVIILDTLTTSPSPLSLPGDRDLSSTGMIILESITEEEAGDSMKSGKSNTSSSVFLFDDDDDFEGPSLTIVESKSTDDNKWCTIFP